MFFLYRDTPITKTTILFTYCFSDRGSKIVTELALNLVFPPYDCSTLFSATCTINNISPCFM